MTVVTVRRLHAGDERVVAQLADHEPQTALLADERTVFVAAFAGEEPVGLAFGYLLPRRRGDAEIRRRRAIPPSRSRDADGLRRGLAPPPETTTPPGGC